MARGKEEEQRLSFRLDLGVDNTAQAFMVQPFGEAGALVASTNTRLSRTRGVPRKSPLAAAKSDPASPHSGSTACGGIVPCGHMSSNLVVRNRRYGQQRIADASLMPLAAPLSGPLRQFWPADVPRAGVVPMPGQYTAPAMCSLNGYLWFASIRYDSGAIGVFVTVVGPNGECAALPMKVVALGSGSIAAPPWVGLTAHGANGIRLWYRNGTSTAVLLSTLTLASGLVVATSPVTAYTPVAAGAGTYDVTALDDSTAYLVTLGSALATNVALTKVAVATNTVTNTTLIAAAFATTTKLAVKAATLSGGARIAVSAALFGSTLSCYLYEDTGTPNLLHAVVGVLTSGEPLAGFYQQGATEYVIYGVADVTCTVATTGFTGSAGLLLQFRTPDVAGTLTGEITLPWTRALSRFMTHSPASGEMYPMLCVQTCWDSNDGNVPSSHAWLSDPDVRVVRIDSNATVSTVGRFGVDTAAIYPADPAGGTLNVLYNSQVACISGDKFAFNYFERQVDQDFATGSATLRYVEMDFGARQPRVAVGADGVAIVAGAMPMEWDGVTFSEINPPVRPKVAVVDTGGTGPAIPAGDYLVCAVHQWVDGAGVLHRSMPSELVEVTAGGGSWILYVSIPALLVRDGLSNDKYETILYVSEEGESVPFRQYVNATSSTSFVDTYSDFALADGDAVHPPIYTTGDPAEELMSQHPPANLDVAVVGDRGWCIEAERPRRLWHTKIKAKGVAYEWSSDLTVDLPPGALRALAIVDMNGSVAALCEGGVWIITGQGPDNTLISGGWNPPEQVSDIACSDRGSVIRTPVGVMFISNGRFAMIGAGGQRMFEQIDASALGTVSPVLLRDAQEVVWFSSSGVHMVYNYQLDRWTTWDANTVPGCTCAVLDPVSGYVNVVRASDGAVWQLDPSLPSVTAQMGFATGHMALGGPQDDTVLDQVLVHGAYAGAHGLTVTLTPDYGQQADVSRSFSAADIAACNEAGQYVLSVALRASLRALKVTLAETGATGEAFRPTDVTVMFAKNPGSLIAAVREPGRK